MVNAMMMCSEMDLVSLKKPVDSNGNYNCPPTTEDWVLGCIDRTMTEANCNGTWIVRATTPAECLAHGKFCNDGVNLDPIFQWSPAKWGLGTVIQTKWVNSSLVNEHVWGTRIKQDELESLFQIAILIKLGYIIRTSLLCTFNPIVKLLGLFACDCGNFAGSPATCFPDTPDIVNVGQGVAFSQNSGCIQSEKAVVCWKNTTVIDAVDNAVINVNVIYAQQIVDTSSVTTKRSVSNGYVIVYDDKNELIGQVVGDTIQIDAVGGNPGTVFSDTFQICVPPNSAIPIDSHFTTMDLAYKLNMADNLVAQKLTITQISGKWCANVDKNGYYAAAMTSNIPYVVNTGYSFILSIVVLVLVLLA